MVEEDLGNLAYVDRYGRNGSEATFLCQKSQCVRRYHMRYTRGWESPEDRLVKLPTLFIDRVAIRGDIIERKLGIVDISNGDREEVQKELDMIKNRWGSGRSKNGIGKSKRPLLTATEWARVQIRKRA